MDKRNRLPRRETRPPSPSAQLLAEAERVPASLGLVWRLQKTTDDRFLALPEPIPGAKGEQGEQGVQGNQGIQGQEGKQGPKGDDGKDGTSVRIVGSVADPLNLPDQDNTAGTNVIGDGYIIGEDLWVWTGTIWKNVGVIKGPKGDKGDQGIEGKQGDQGVQGKQGVKGDNGDKGDKGDTGNTGLSAYEIWIAAGNVGNEQDFIDYLKADTAVPFEKSIAGRDIVNNKFRVPKGIWRMVVIEAYVQHSKEDYTVTRIGDEDEITLLGGTVKPDEIVYITVFSLLHLGEGSGTSYDDTFVLNEIEELKQTKADKDKTYTREEVDTIIEGLFTTIPVNYYSEGRPPYVLDTINKAIDWLASERGNTVPPDEEEPIVTLPVSSLTATAQSKSSILLNWINP